MSGQAVLIPTAPETWWVIILADQIALANSVAQQYFNVPTYAGLNAQQKTMVATAKNIRQTNLGNLWLPEPGVGFNSIQPSYVVSPSYKINEDMTTYVSWQYGEKAGFSQTPNGIALLVQPEKATSYEIGFKSLVFDKSLTFDIDFFYTDISNYQQAVQVEDVIHDHACSPIQSQRAAHLHILDG